MYRPFFHPGLAVFSRCPAKLAAFNFEEFPRKPAHG
jgi:hypothetical protein